MTGPGTLNRYMEQAAFRRTLGEASAMNPPLFKLITTFVNCPKRQEISDAMDLASKVVAKLSRDREKMNTATAISSSDSKDKDKDTESSSSALRMLLESSDKILLGNYLNKISSSQ
eukprot:gene43240-57542_t